MATCNKGFPDGATYRTVTAASIAASATAKRGKKMSHTVATVDIENTIAVVMPSAALGNRTDSDECVAPLTTPLLLWDCLLDGSAVSSPVHVSALIDDVSAAVLINEDLTFKLGLCRHKLPRPVPFNVALATNKKETFLCQTT